MNAISAAYGQLAVALTGDPLLLLASAVATFDPFWAAFDEDDIDYETDPLMIALQVTRGAFPDIYAEAVERLRAAALEGDRLSVAQSLRVVGSVNTKPSRGNALCQLIELHDQRCCINDFTTYLPRPAPRRASLRRKQRPRLPMTPSRLSIFRCARACAEWRRRCSRCQMTRRSARQRWRWRDG